MAGMIDFIQKNPYMLMGLAQGLLSPRLRGQSAFGAGLAGLMGGMQNQLQMNQYNKELAKQTAQEEAVARLMGDPSVYQPQLAPQTPMPTGPQMTPAPGMSQSRMGMNMTPIPGTEPGPTSLELLSEAIKPQTSQTVLEPMYDRRKDMMTAIGPEKVLAAQFQKELDPFAGMPDSVKETMYYEMYPGLAERKAMMATSGPAAEARSLGFDVSTPEGREQHRIWQETMRVLGRPVNNINTGENQFEKGLAGVASSQIEAANTRFETAINSLPNLLRMKQALNNGLRTGATAEVREVIAGLLTDLGADSQSLNNFFNLTEGADFTSAKNQMVTAIVKTLGPNPTDSDRRFIEAILPQMKNNPQAAIRLIDRIYTGNLKSMDEYGRFVNSLPKDSYSAKLLKKSYETRMETYNSWQNKMKVPPGVPSGSLWQYTTMDGGEVYRTPDGQFVEYKE